MHFVVAVPTGSMVSPCSSGQRLEMGVACEVDPQRQVLPRWWMASTGSAAHPSPPQHDCVSVIVAGRIGAAIVPLGRPDATENCGRGYGSTMRRPYCRKWMSKANAVDRPTRAIRAKVVQSVNEKALSRYRWKRRQAWARSGSVTLRAVVVAGAS